MRFCLHSSSHMISYSTREIYIKRIVEVMPLWIERVAIGRLYVWQQNFAPCFTARKSQNWLKKNFSNHDTPDIWLLNSLDCLSLGYCVGGAIERETNKTSCNIKNELKARITAAFTNLNKETCGKAFRRFPSRS